MKEILRKYRLIAGLIIIAGLWQSHVLSAEIIQLSPEAEVSLITISAANDEVYTLYGHTALRVRDPQTKMDWVFNYGIFSFEHPNFIYRFARGETDYMLGVQRFTDFLLEYEMRGSEVTEQTLQLDKTERQTIWEALVKNSWPENREYRYNFFYDNCATRPAAIIEQSVKGSIILPNEDLAKTDISFRTLINQCTQQHPWLTFGCDLALGLPTDQPITQQEKLFLPTYLMEAYKGAFIQRADKEMIPLVERETRLAEAITDDTTEWDIWNNLLTPITVGWLLFGIIVILTLIEWKRHCYLFGIDVLLFTIAGIGGCVLFFLCFLSTHPCIWPNLSIAWLHPLHIVGVILFTVKKLRKIAYSYHFINFAALTLLPFAWIMIGQQLNAAFIPLIMSLWLRSGAGVYRKIWNIA